jgi:hypothetical protein
MHVRVFVYQVLFTYLPPAHVLALLCCFAATMTYLICTPQQQVQVFVYQVLFTYLPPAHVLALLSSSAAAKHLVLNLAHLRHHHRHAAQIHLCWRAQTAQEMGGDQRHTRCLAVVRDRKQKAEE